MRFIVRKTLSRATKIIALGESIKEQFSFVSNFDQKVVVVHNGPPSVIPGCTNIPKCLRLGSTIHILYLSNLIPSKGFIDVLQSCRILKERGYKNFHFDFCGAFNLSNEAVDKEFLQSPKLFDAWVNQYNLQPYVTYHGTVKGKAKDQILRKANVFILPTRYPTEGQPISIIEAMAYGLPVIATPWKGIVDQVIPGETGYFVKFNSPEQIADKVIEITQDPIHYTDLSHGAITHYQSEFTRERHIDQMTRLFKQVFGPKRMK
jgi:glycosyltransferase involved in cell wall biosynthesis